MERWLKFDGLRVIKQVADGITKMEGREALLVEYISAGGEG